MSAAAEAATASADVPAGKSGGKKKLMVLLATLLLLGGGGAGVWFSGLGPKLLGHHEAAAEKPKEAAPAAPVFVELPEMVANLNTGGRRASYVKLVARLEVAREEDKQVLTAAMPRIVDLFQTYLREMHPEELRGSAGTYRLREELMARVGVAAPPAHVLDVLFTQMIVQ